MKPISHELISQLPKVELHCHLDGSLRINSILDIAKKEGIKLPSYNLESLRPYLKAGKKRGTLEDYIKRLEDSFD